MISIACLACAGPNLPARARPPDLGATFTELNEAAKAGCEWIWAHEPDKAKEIEYCGALCQDSDGIRVTVPMTTYSGTCGTPTGEPNPPEGTRLLGKYHSHRFEPEPSRPDRRNAKRYPWLSHFLCAPSGIVRRYGAEGAVIVK